MNAKNYIILYMNECKNLYNTLYKYNAKILLMKLIKMNKFSCIGIHESYTI